MARDESGGVNIFNIAGRSGPWTAVFRSSNEQRERSRPGNMTGPITFYKAVDSPPTEYPSIVRWPSSNDAMAKLKPCLMGRTGPVCKHSVL